MKKLWIINQYTITPEYPASTRHYELAKYSAKYFDVTLWGSNFIHHNKTFRSKRRWRSFEETLEGFRLVWLAALPYKDNDLARTVNMLLYALTLFLVGLFRRGKPDVVLGSSPPLFAAYASILIAKLRGAKFILEVRDLWPDSLTEITGKEGGLVVRTLRWMEQSLYRNADLVIGLTEGIIETVAGRGVPSEKLLFLPNGIDLDATYSAADGNIAIKIREELRLSPEDKVFMYAGAHGPANDLSQLIQAAEALSDDPAMKFVLMGEGVEKQQLQKMAKERGLTNVIFLPAVPKSEVQQYLSCADVYLICLKDIPLYEGALPNKLFDYLLQDKPIVSTVPGELKFFLEKRGLGYYGNMKERGKHYLPEVLRSIARGENVQPEMAGSTLVREKFSRQGQAESLMHRIDQLFEL